MKTKGKIRFSATHSNLTMLQTNTNAAQAVWSITLAQQLKHSSAAPTNHNNKFLCATGKSKSPLQSLHPQMKMIPPMIHWIVFTHIPPLLLSLGHTDSPNSLLIGIHGTKLVRRRWRLIRSMAPGRSSNCLLGSMQLARDGS
jgi:hypothetical protein